MGGLNIYPYNCITKCVLFELKTIKIPYNPMYIKLLLEKVTKNKADSRKKAWTTV